MQFSKYENFNLHAVNWGEAQFQDITKLLDNVIEVFYANLDLNIITEKQVYVVNSKSKIPQADYPEIIKLEKCNIIYLSVCDRLWCQYSYQFAHELCHHVIDNDFFCSNDKFGWLEESLCELASIFCIDRMSQVWLSNPPYPNWNSYSANLADYVKNIIEDPQCKISKPFKEWLSENIDKLFIDRYMRDVNRIIALHILPLFNERPELWVSIQYLKLIKVTDEMTLSSFIDCWIEVVPDKQKELLGEIKAILV